MKLTAKFFVTFLLASLLPLLLLGLSVQEVVRGSLNSMARRVQRETAQRAAEHVAGYFENIQNALTLAQDRADEGALTALLDNYACFSAVAFFDNAGRLVRSNARTLEGWRDLQPVWPRLREQAARSGAWLGPVDFAAAAGVPRSLIAVPIGDDPDHPRGFLVGRVNLLDLGVQLRALDVGGGLVLVFGPDNRLIAHSLRTGEISGTGAPAAGSEGQIVRAGRPIWWAREAVQGLPTGWQVVFEQPMDQVFGIVNTVRGRIGIFTVGAGLLALALCWLVTGQVVVKRLRQIQAAVEAIRRREFNLYLKADSKDEIGQLGRRVLDAANTLESDVRRATIGVMVQKISHDIRKPFTNIRASLEIARRHIQGLDGLAEKHLGYIQESTDQGMEYIEEMLTLGKDRRPPQKAPIDVAQLLQKVRERTGVPAGVEIRIETSGAPRCALDAAEAERALANLIENAINALPPQNGRVILRAQATGEHVAIAVEDNGQGMTEEIQRQLFNDFFTTRTGGTGLGMGIVRRIVDRHGGKIQIDSRLGRGTKVTLLFPASLPTEEGLLHA